MPAINFQKQFAGLVASGHKRQTIRPKRSFQPIKVGDALYFFTNMRRHDCQRLGEAICKAVIPITMTFRKTRVIVDGKELSPHERLALALEDGFTGTQDMINWFSMRYGGRIFHGILVKW